MGLPRQDLGDLFLPDDLMSEFSLIYVIMEVALSGLDQRVLTLTHHMGEEEEANSISFDNIS